MSVRNILFVLIAIGIAVFVYSSCGSILKNATAVKPFDKEKYLGKWYEIARFDFKFERHLNNTTAEYSLNDNGTILVKNRGYHTIDKEWRESIGKAKFAKDDKTAMLKVSFFGPFYGGCNVIAIDDDYQYALVAGESLKYLWILSRETTIPEDVKENYRKIAQEVGYDTSELLWIEHDSK